MIANNYFPTYYALYSLEINGENLTMPRAMYYFLNDTKKSIP